MVASNFRTWIQIIFISCRDQKRGMKFVPGIIIALLLTMVITGCTSYTPGTPNVTTRVPGPGVTSMVETLPAATTPVGQISTSPGSEVPVNTTHYGVFFLEPVNDYHIGETITLHGTTILAAGDPLLVEVVSSSFGPAPKSSSQTFTGVSGIAIVQEGPPGSPNSWSFSFPTDGFIVDTYMVTVSGITINVRDGTTFMLKPRL
jgi:hypothetical protein